MDRLFAALQAFLPQHLISSLFGRVAMSTLWIIKKPFIHIFSWLYKVDLSESEESDPNAYASFNSFFTRGLRDGAREIAQESDAIVAPADGVISQCGAIQSGQLLQAKGRQFSVAQLLGDERLATAYHRGSFLTIYLAPHNYHRVHVPIDARLQQMTHIPGRLFSVSPSTTRAVEHLFARNERVVFHFDTAAGPVALVMVGALIVGSVETAHAGIVAPGSRQPRVAHYEPALQFERGQQLAQFNIGSTVVVLFSKDGATLEQRLRPELGLQVGETIARM